jgi:hypothetical protein
MIETVYKYVPVCHLLPTNYRIIFWTAADDLCLQQCTVASLSASCSTRRSAGPHKQHNRSAVACLCSWTVMARRYWRSVGNSTRKYRYSEVGWPSGPSDVAETTNTGNTVLHVPMHHCDWPYEMASSPLPFPFSPTTTSYRADAILKFAMCQSAPCHPAVGAKCCQCSLFSIYNNKYRVFNYLSPIHVHETVDRNYIWSLLTAWSRVLQKRKVSQLFKKFPHFTEHECSLPHSQVPATFP